MAVRRAFLTLEGKPRPEGPFRQGEEVVVQVVLQAGRSFRNVAVVDALPAGFEIENPNLATSDGGVQVKAGEEIEVTRSDIRDDRLVLFANAAPGRRVHSYVARAVTVGRFALPPIGAECMYDSARSSLHGGGVVEVVR